MTLHAIAAEGFEADAATTVAIFLHGYGSNERDLTALAQGLPAGMAWVSLRAPIVLAPGSYSWFPITEPGNPEPVHVTAATDAIWSWVDAALPADARIVPIGFSQGGLMASQLLRTNAARVIAPVLLGGFVLGGTQPEDERLARERPAVFSGRGAEDQVIASAAVDRTDAWLPVHSTLTAPVYPGLAHGINAAELADVRAFLAEHVGEGAR